MMKREVIKSKCITTSLHFLLKILNVRIFGWNIEGAVYGTHCGEIESGSALVFLGFGKRKVCTPYLDTTLYGNLRFHFSMGAGECDPGESHDNDIFLFGRSEGRRQHVLLDTLPFSAYKVILLHLCRMENAYTPMCSEALLGYISPNREGLHACRSSQCGIAQNGGFSCVAGNEGLNPKTPSVVSVALPTELQTPVTQFCLEQRFHAGVNRHVWALDFLQLLPVMPAAYTHMAQFSINIGCGSYQPTNSISLEFSTNHGRSWSLLHMECLPELCSGPHLPHSTVYSSENYSGSEAASPTEKQRWNDVPHRNRSGAMNSAKSEKDKKTKKSSLRLSR
ncbi:hypothetical protein QTP70_021274 [Hemibagrus guttatus]|uniref:Reelin n=1 Tax=Hemibagrus guttatus TaxID=175788 RepID=A0AAE0V8R3_9TELE|nr:hypothetical protein QTP70_021274 [Hemibagrus guttatus]